MTVGATPSSRCSTCGEPLSARAAFCSSCGSPSPTHLTGTAAPLPDAEESVFRERLQRALGDGYHLRGKLGSGGFGVVYAAWDRQLERDVAIKALRHDLFQSADMLERFRRETRVVANLRHPNIVPIFAVGDADGLAYMVMPLVKGETLRSVLRREGTMEVEPALRLAVGVARALETAHAAGVVHRDVKPENLMIEDTKRRVSLMDFGIARVLDGSAALTGAGLAIGTPAYMSPEQARGGQVDPRSDIYALGIVAYEMLAGAPPFDAENLVELLHLQLTAEPPAIHDRRADVPADAEAAIMRCLEKNPDDRFASAAALGDVLRRCTCL
jgi:serine/threonine protein kinase